DYYQPGGPIFLEIGGEWDIDEAGGRLETHVGYLDYAQRHKGAFYYLEHRYYGQSIPLLPQDREDIKWLSSEQALADVAVFIESVNRYKGYTYPKWVVIGCSYAGMLSSWFRQAYPSLTVGAIASSAPVQAKVDFFEAYEVVDRDLKMYGENCSDAVQTALNEAHALVQTQEGRQRITELFG
ncbi:serine protease K12H4.7-like protein, partial [Aphelenchoides avenae]